MLSDHWQSEVIKLEELVDGIVDPLAFFQVCDIFITELKTEWTNDMHANPQIRIFTSLFFVQNPLFTPVPYFTE